MTQLIIEGTTYPEAYGDNGSYSCVDEDLSQTVSMISGRTVIEVRGRVRVVSYTHKFFDDELMRKCLSDLRSKRVVTALVLTQEDDSLKQGTFICTSLPNPEYLMSIDGKPYWTNISFTLREVDPHD